MCAFCTGVARTQETLWILPYFVLFKTIISLSTSALTEAAVTDWPFVGLLQACVGMSFCVGLPVYACAGGLCLCVKPADVLYV